MDFKDIKNKKESELHAELATSRSKLLELKFKDANKQLKNVRAIRLIKKDISRLLTLLNSSKK